jgi:hypothetical protein
MPKPNRLQRKSRKRCAYTLAAGDPNDLTIPDPPFAAMPSAGPLWPGLQILHGFTLWAPVPSPRGRAIEFVNPLPLESGGHPAEAALVPFVTDAVHWSYEKAPIPKIFRRAASPRTPGMTRRACRNCDRSGYMPARPGTGHPYRSSSILSIRSCASAWHSASVS